MELEKINFHRLNEPHFEKIFDVATGDLKIVRVRGFAPELRERQIVFPVEFTNEKGEVLTLGFSLDEDHMRDLFQAYDFPDEL